ncbi:MAG: hypothetical protein ABI002_00665, partial [Saprospiraceae bacterium]
MNYELAKELKDAGFPIKKRCMCIEEICVHQYYPTLSELIKACGDNIGVFKISDTECNAWQRGNITLEDPEIEDT